MNFTFNLSLFNQAVLNVSPSAFTISPSLKSLVGTVTASLSLPEPPCEKETVSWF